MHKYVIVGSSAGAIGAIEAIREVDSRGTIAVVSEEPLPSYSRAMIGEYLSGDVALTEMRYRGDDFWRLNKVDTYLGQRAVKLDVTEKYVELAGGERLEFQKVLLAMGAEPLIATIAGVEREGVFTFTTLADVEAVMGKVREGGRAVVIGGGLIGICVAEALVKRNVEVTIVELRKAILSLLLDSVSSEIVTTAIRRNGVNVITGHAVHRIAGTESNENKVGAVILDSGEVLPCDVVVMAIGVKPCIELTLGTPIETNRGIIVDRFMRTSVPDVYACGDVAEAYDFIAGENQVLPQWPTAYLGGRIAGFNMAGEVTHYPGGVVMSALKYFAVPVIAAGKTHPAPTEGYRELISHDPASVSYRKLVVMDGMIKGFIFVNDIERAGIFFYLLRHGIDVEEFEEQLLTEDFGLLSLPEPLRDAMLAESVMA